MRRAITIALVVLVIALLPAQTLAAIRSTKASAAKPKKTVVTRKVSGPAAQADRWGTVQVILTVRKTTVTNAKGKKTVTRRIVGVASPYEVHSDRSAFIMEQSLPLLRQQVLQITSVDQLQLVSGATDTSYAFAESLQAALLLAKKV